MSFITTPPVDRSVPLSLNTLLEYDSPCLTNDTHTTTATPTPTDSSVDNDVQLDTSLIPSDLNPISRPPSTSTSSAFIWNTNAVAPTPIEALPTHLWQYGHAVDTPMATPPLFSFAHSQPFALPICDNNRLLFDSHPGTGITQTPTTATTQWSQPSAPPTAARVDSFVPPPPPPTASLATPNSLGTLPFGAPYTGLSPMFASFDTVASPTEQASSYTRSHAFARPTGPIRGYSTSAAQPSGRKRSVTLATLGTTSTASPASRSSFASMYPYPSPRAVLPLTFSSQRQEVKRVFHPNPSPGISPPKVSLPHPPQVDIGIAESTTETADTQAPKQPRFKPTKEQLDVLIAFYNENKNPDSTMREALAKQLGGGVKQKTLQIWFQNRRSKARAKERDANLPKPIDTGEGGSMGHGASASISSTGKAVEALRPLVHDDEQELTILPIKVLSIANWTRFLTPGTSVPDLAAAIHFPSLTLHLYVMHKADTFRINIPLTPACVAAIEAAANPSLNTDSIAVRFELTARVASYSTWLSVGEWVSVVDFTGGEASAGGQCELTGNRENLLNAFNQVQRLLFSQSSSNASTSQSLSSSSSSCTTSPAGYTAPAVPWRMPLSTATSFTTHPNPYAPPASDGTSFSSLGVASGDHFRRRSFSQPPLLTGMAQPYAQPLLAQPTAPTTSFNSSFSPTPSSDMPMSWSDLNINPHLDGGGHDSRLPSRMDITTPHTAGPGLATFAGGPGGRSEVGGGGWKFPLAPTVNAGIGSGTLPTPMTSTDPLNFSLSHPTPQNTVPAPTPTSFGDYPTLSATDMSFAYSNMSGGSEDHSLSQASPTEVGTPPLETTNLAEINETGAGGSSSSGSMNEGVGNGMGMSLELGSVQGVGLRVGLGADIKIRSDV